MAYIKVNFNRSHLGSIPKKKKLKITAQSRPFQQKLKEATSHTGTCIWRPTGAMWLTNISKVSYGDQRTAK